MNSPQIGLTVRYTGGDAAACGHAQRPEEDDESCAELASAREHGFAVRLEERYVIAFGKLAGLRVVDGVCHDDRSHPGG